MSLRHYQSKRDFSKTREPRGERSSNRRLPSSHVIFVIQKHAARRLHYDFRLEIGGVLKSWAVPKGMPLAKGEKRLAMQVEDHPSAYGNFEGIIPAGNYGAGTVMLWDAGLCEVLEGRPGTALREGKLLLRLQGRKLRGHWTLVRMRPREGMDENAWLLIKTSEDAPHISGRADDLSILSGRTMKQITQRADQTWQSDRTQRAPRVRKAVRPPSLVSRQTKVRGRPR